VKPRFRIFAGPNGSGKSTLFEYLRSKKNIHTEIYVSADRIEAELRKKNAFVFNAYRVSTSEDDFYKNLRLNYNFSYYDSMIVSAALQSECEVIYSEDMQHNQIIEKRLQIINPFTS